jgi:pimeloyl-ACP methyl ester carboxylesterase
MKFSEEPVHFESRGYKLFGIFHPASDGNKDFGIIFANSGMQNRVGPHRLYVVFARILSQIGYSVLRIDLPGIGESEGTITEDNFDAQNPDDTISAINFLKNTIKIKKIALFGICAGARNVLKAGSKDKRVEGLILWSLPIISIAPSMTSPNQDPRGWMSKRGIILSIKDKLRKAISIPAWKKYLASGGNIKSIFRDFRGIFWNLVSKEKIWSQERHHKFFTAFSSYMRSGRPALFLYGEKDNILIEEFKVKMNELSANINHSCDYLIIRNGNHTFTSMDTQKEAIAETIEWLSRWSNREKSS